MFESVTVENLDTQTLIGLDTFTAGRAMIALLDFMQGTETSKTYRVDNAALQSLRRAAASYCKLDKDRVSTFTQYKSDKTWKRLRVNESAPKGAETRKSSIRFYSGEQARLGVTTLREQYGISLDKLADRSTSDAENGYSVIALRKLDTQNES